MNSSCQIRIHQTAVFLCAASIGFLVATVSTGCSSSKKQVEETEETPKKLDGDSEYRNAQIEFRNQEYEKATETLKRALEADLELYSRSTVLQLLGQSYRLQGKYEESIDAFSKSIEADPKNHEALVFRGVVYRLQKKYDLADESYQAALKIKPDSPTLHISIGALSIFRKQFDRAVEHLKMAIEFDPANPIAHSNMAIALANLERFDEAQASLKTANILGYKKADVVQAQIDQLKFAAIKQNSIDSK